MQTPDDSLQTLLEHDAWARRVAARLVGSSRADDLVQELWLAVLKTGRRPTGDARAWLSGILRNLALQQRRGEGRREKRERAAARPEPICAAGTLVEEAEISRELSDAIARLNEPYRSAVLRRYVDGQRADEIANASATPASTVRNRVRRGLSRMKDRLTSRYGGDPRRLLFPIAFLLPRRRSGERTRLPWAAAACAVAVFSCFAAAESSAEPVPAPVVLPEPAPTPPPEPAPKPETSAGEERAVRL